MIIHYYCQFVIRPDGDATIIASSVQTGSGEVFAMADFCSSDVVLIKFKSLVSFRTLVYINQLDVYFLNPLHRVL